MKKITRWRPDTCDCEIDYSWDTDDTKNEMTFTLEKFLKVCSAHSAEKDYNKLFEIVNDENKRKNFALKIILDNVDLVTENYTNLDGTTAKILKKGLSYKWSFDSERKLLIDISNFPAKSKTEIVDLLSREYGASVHVIM